MKYTYHISGRKTRPRSNENCDPVVSDKGTISVQQVR